MARNLTRHNLQLNPPPHIRKFKENTILNFIIEISIKENEVLHQQVSGLEAQIEELKLSKLDNSELKIFSQ